jgi:hypothetical protein
MRRISAPSADRQANRAHQGGVVSSRIRRKLCPGAASSLLDLLAHWGQDCGAGGGQIPRNVQDCIDKIGFGDPVAVEACIMAVSEGSE